jgi:hypothetical protein
MRLCDLPVSLDNAPVRRLADIVFEELERHGLVARPSIWLSEEWFNPDGVTGFAIPFYLAHPRLIRLERQMMLEAEGAAKWECLKILRHETGHAIDEAYQLYKRDDYAAVFGPPWKEYPASYKAEPLSRLESRRATVANRSDDRTALRGEAVLLRNRCAEPV